MMRRFTLSASALLALLLGTVTPAMGGAPTHEIFGPVDPFVLPAGEFCAFDVLVEDTRVRIHERVWVDADGTVRITDSGPILSTLTNMPTGFSLAVNASGPAFITIGSDGSFSMVGAGKWLLGRPGEGLILASGSLVLGGTLADIVATLNGRWVDVSALLH